MLFNASFNFIITFSISCAVFSILAFFTGKLQKSIYELQKSRTSVSIAHRLSTIVDSDVIFVLENGKIIEKGKHDDLMKLGGKYATLYKYSNTS